MSVVLHLGDCLDPISGMASLSDRSADHVITDPPYSDHVHAQHKVGGGARCNGRSRYKDLTFAAASDELRSCVATHVSRIARRWVLVFCDAESVNSWKESLCASGLEHVRVGAWVKRGSTPQFSGDRPAPGWEAIVIAHQRGRKRWNGGGHHAVWEAPIVTGPERCHTTQKPLELIEQLLRDFTDAGDTILDPFAGSGTTGVACRKLGRRFVGWERDPKYHTAALARINATVEQLDLTPATSPRMKQTRMGDM